jgi:hypothetical protein
VLGDTTSGDDGATGFAPVDPAMTAPAAPQPLVQPAATQPSEPYAATPYSSGPYAAEPRTYLYAQPPSSWPAPSWPQAAAPAPAPRAPWSRRRRVLVTTASVVAGAVLVTGTAAAGRAVGRAGRDAQQRQQEVSARVQAELPRLEAFVATATGRPWRSTPTVQVLADDDFVDAMHSSRGGASPVQPEADDDDLGVTAAAMGLAHDPDTYWDAGSAGTDSNVTGFYDDSAKTLYVRGSSWEPVVEITVVHELTHANQDQAFDLHRITGATRTDDESWNALQSLIEGEATVVERDYAATQDAAWQQSVRTSDGSGTPSDVPVVDTEAAFPYEIGADFVSGLRRAGGTAAVTRAFLSPPRWSRDLLAPEAWLAGSLPPVRLPARPASPSGSSSDVADVGVLGVEGLWLAVDSAHPAKAHFVELSGWVGDSYVSTENDNADTWCFVDDAAFTTPASRDRALAFLAAWTDRNRIQVTKPSPTTVRLRGCEMG